MAFRTTRVPKPKIVYLNLAPGFTTFTIENIERFRYVHFINDSAGIKRKKWCVTSGCPHCANGSPRNLRMTMQVTHNGDLKTLEVGSALANRIINDHSVGDTITIEKMGSGLRTTYNIIKVGTSSAGIVPGTITTVGIPMTSFPAHSDDEKKEGLKELMYDLQRIKDYEEKYDLIKYFAREF